MNLKVYSPPILEGFSKGSLMEAVDNPEIAKDALDLPNHTQKVERCIKDLTFVATRHAKEDRDSVMTILQDTREQWPKNTTKKDYNLYLESDI